MYLNFFHMTQEPFRVTPDPAFLFLSPSHKEALGSIVYGVEKRKGFVLITGEVGTGKTTIIRSYLESPYRKKIKPVYIFNANVSFRELLKSILEELGVEFQIDGLYVMLRRLHRFLIDEYTQGYNIVLIVDEAQNMPVETLEQLRVLSNLETNEDKLVQIVLVGQPELENKLNLNELRQLKQRVAVRTAINPLTYKESFAYVKHRLSLVTLRGDSVFTGRALKRIVKHAKGVPRILNILCDNALIAGYGYQRRPITSRIAKQVIADFEGKRRPYRLIWKLAAAGALIVLASFFVWPLDKRDAVFSMVKNAYFSQVAQGTPFSPEGTEAGEAEALVSPLASDTATSEQAVDFAPVSEGLAQSFVPPAELAATVLEGYQSGAANGGLSLALVPPPELAGDAKEATVDPMRVNESSPSLHNPIGEDRSDASVTLEQENLNKTKRTYPTTRVVKEGDSLSALCLDVYGFTSSKVVEWVKENNRQIGDADLILIGDKILFPQPPFQMDKAEGQPTSAAL